jgi:hypothetical protein
VTAVDYRPAQQQVIDLLGRGADVVFDPSLGQALADALEDGLAPLVPHLPDEALWIGKHDLATVHGCEAHFLATQDAFGWSIPTVRGTVAHKAIELSVHWRGDPSPMLLVDSALAILGDDERGAGRYLAGLDEVDRAQLRGEATDLTSKFLECFPPLKPQWYPVTESRARVELLDGRLVLGAKVDLTLGRANGTTARKVIIDLKSGLASLAHREDLRFYALIETIRLGVPPRLLATYYLDAARAQPEEVTPDLLVAAARRTIDGVHKIVELQHAGREAQVRPGGACRWCPARASCPEGMVYLETTDN